MHGNKIGEPINLDSFYGTVTSVVSKVRFEYEVTENDGKIHNIHQKDARLRKCHNVVFGHVSEDKSHDTYMIQHYTNNELKQLEKYMAENVPHYIPNGKIECLHTQSDNAASHFKSQKSMNYYSQLINERGGSSKCAFV